MIDWRREIRGFSIFLTLFLMSSSIWAVAASRIELKNGTVYESVTFTVSKIFKVLSIKGKGWEKDVSFTDVQIILDENGQDVTSEFLGGYVAPVIEPKGKESNENWISKTDPTSVMHDKSPWKGSFRLNMEYALPTGKYYESIKGGVGFGGDISLAVSKNLALRVTVSRSGMHEDPEELAAPFIVVNDDLSVSVWRYFLSVEYFEGPDWRKNKKTGFSAYGGLGALSHNTTGTMLIRDPVTDSLFVLFPLQGSQSKFAMTSGFSISTLVAPTFGFDFEGVLDLVFIGSTSGNNYYSPYGNVQTSIVLNFRMGLIKYF